ncbi:MAG: CopD family protein, partial [Dehalococcoidia bacterium]|nr:CopD family protein [Dehalococcoidia bacterium]
IATGVFNGFVQLPRLPALWDTTYGRVLIAKLALILPLLGVAGLNAVLLKPRLVAAIDELHAEDLNERPTGSERTRLETALRRLQSALPRTTAAEFLLGVAVLASVGVLAQSTTADGELRQEATAPAGEFAASEQENDLDVELLIEPFGITVNTFTVTLTPQAEAELGEVLGVRLLATFDDPNLPPSAGISATRQELEPTDNPAVWSADAALLTQPGDWRIETRVRRRGLDDTSVRFSVPGVGGFLARADEPEDLFDLPFTYVGWNIVAGGAMVALGLAAFLVWHNRPPSWRGATAASVGLSSALGLVAGAVLLFGVHGNQGDFPRTSPIEATEESLAIGQNLFERNCITCHGQTGEGDGPAAEGLEFPPPRLGDHVPFHNDGTLFLWISEGIPLDSEPKNMPSFKERLTEDERWHLVNFLRATFDTGTFEPVLPEDLAPQGIATPTAGAAP